MIKIKTKSYDLSKTSECILRQEISKSSSSQQRESTTIKKKSSSTYLGVFYSVMCSVCIMMTSVFVKKLTYISPAQLSMVRNFGVFLGNLPIAIYTSKNVFGPKKYFWLLVIRSFLGATALYLNLIAYKLLPLAEASIIMSTVPSLVTVAARLYLKEPCGFVQITSIIMTALGVLLSVRLPEVIQNKPTVAFTADYIKGLVSAFGCVLILTFTYISLRQMTNIHFSVVLLYYGLLGVLENSTITATSYSFETPRCGGWDTLQIILIAVFGFAGHCFMTMAIQTDLVSTASTCKAAADIAVASLFQILFFNSVPDFYSLGGGVLVIFAVGSLGLWKWLMTLPEDSVHRKRMRWFLLSWSTAAF